ncbi:VWA domain-containing protein [candidate division WOR-3 bacterium]|nr:VWA domain-containing protein [candidate division WOR-3 bacterium]
MSKFKLIALTVVFGISISSKIYAQETQPADLQTLFQARRPKADFILLLDTSLSMRPYFYTVLDALEPLVNALPDSDQIFIYRFDNVPIRLCAMPIYEVKQNLQNYLPQAPVGLKTDIGAALESAVNEIERRDAAPLQFIFFLTDGKNDPPSESRFFRQRQQSWDSLLQRGRKASRKCYIKAYGLGIGKQTGIVLLNKVFRNVELLPTSPRYLKNTIKRVRETLVKEWLRGAVTRELQDSYIEILPEDKACKWRVVRNRSVSVKFHLKSAYSHLHIPFTFQKTSMTTDKGKRLSTKLLLETATFNLRPGSQETFKLILQPPPSRFSFGKKRITITDTLSFNVSASFPQEQEIQSLGLKPNVNIEGLKQPFSLVQEIGVSIIFFIVLFLSLGMVVFTFSKTRIQSETVFGKVILPKGKTQKLDECHKKEITIGKEAGCDIRLEDISSPITIKVNRREGYDSLELAGKGIKVDGKIIYAPMDIAKDVAEIVVDNLRIMLSDVAPRHTPTRPWGKIFALFVGLFILNFFIWRINP